MKYINYLKLNLYFEILKHLSMEILIMDYIGNYFNWIYWSLNHILRKHLYCHNCFY